MFYFIFLFPNASSALLTSNTHLYQNTGSSEYKGVDERQRMKMIEHETTNIVVTDLDKYYAALDKALLRYHGMKINDINKIIRELWTLTYKVSFVMPFKTVLVLFCLWIMHHI